MQHTKADDPILDTRDAVLKTQPEIKRPGNIAHEISLPDGRKVVGKITTSRKRELNWSDLQIPDMVSTYIERLLTRGWAFVTLCSGPDEITRRVRWTVESA